IDHCSDLLLAPDKKAYDNLLKEGLPKERIKIVGSTAIEASLRNRELARNSNILKELNLQSGKYILCTIHRAENTDDLNILRNILCSLNEIAKSIQIVFPMHPRTKKAILNDNSPVNKKIKIIEPQGYLNFLKLLDNSLFVMSDSGGIQEEAAALNVPCLILRNETEWTYLTDAKKNMLIGTEPRKIIETVKYLLSDRKQIDAMKKVNLKLDKEVSRHILCELKNELKQ
ncbi:MAG: UDP-N-acetylglucosamine 2-epimerase, partial [Firmicutes bacterium]|nr:UDP-N-acetylglucosamine 2-epimerase [Bacillota bacterium]